MMHIFLIGGKAGPSQGGTSVSGRSAPFLVRNVQLLAIHLTFILHAKLEISSRQNS